MRVFEWACSQRGVGAVLRKRLPTVPRIVLQIATGRSVHFRALVANLRASKTTFSPSRMSSQVWRTWTLVAGVSLCLATAQAQASATDPMRLAMQQGAQAMAAKDFTSAVAAYTRATLLEPGLAEAHFNLGLAELQAGDLEQAHAVLEKAAALKPSLRGAHFFLGTVAYRQNHLKEAERGFLLETRIDPRNAKAFLWLGICRLDENEPESAIAPLDEAHRLDPADVDTLYHRGHAYLLVANASYRAMFQLDPDSFRVHQVLAEADAAAYRNGEAIAQYEIAVKTAPRLAGLHESLGDQYWIVGDQDKAAGAYEEELKIDPADATAQFKLGSLRVLRGSAAEGVSLLREALKEDPSLNDAHYYLANGLSDIGQYQEAVQEYKMAIAAGPEDNLAISSYYKLAQAYHKQHRAEDAQQALAKYLALKNRVQAHLDARRTQIFQKQSELPVDVEQAENHPAPD